MSPPSAGILTSPASRPLVSVVIVCALTGRADRAKPAPSDVTTKPRRVKSGFGRRLFARACVGWGPGARSDAGIAAAILEGRRFRNNRLASSPVRESIGGLESRLAGGTYWRQKACQISEGQA